MEKKQAQSSNSSPIQFKVSSRRKKSTSGGESCSGFDTGTGAQAAALAAFATLGNSCNSAVGSINSNPLGPYGANGSCDYDCDTREQTWSWSVDYRTSANASLLSGVAFMNMGGAYNTAFQPTQTWVGTDLPNFGATITGNITTILQIDADIARTGNETPEQAAQLAAAFSSVNTALTNNIGEADRALQNIATFASNNNSNIGYLQTLATNTKSAIDTSATNGENNLIGQLACGADDVRNSFNTMFNDISAKFNNMSGPFATVNSSFQGALQAAELVAGVFLSLQSKSGLVSDYITQAQTYAPASPLRLLRLNSANSEWSAFVAEANTQLGGS